jgi:hypothetical protein
LINQLRQRKGLFSDTDFRRNAIDSYLEKRWKYELYYEVKILHLMEKEYQIANQMIYLLDSKVQNYNQEEVTVGELIEQTQIIERQLDTHDVLKFRENVMIKLRNTLYLRTKLNQRLNYFKSKKEKGIGNFLSTKVSEI